jgi:endonuclease YncB( thermonuclease family)
MDTALFRVRDVQARAGVGPPGRGPAGVYIGDGESDRYAAGYSDIVFAKRSLERICIEAGWAFHRWTTFSEIDTWLAATVASFERDPSSSRLSRRARRRRRGFFCGPEAWARAWPTRPRGRGRQRTRPPDPERLEGSSNALVVALLLGSG